MGFMREQPMEDAGELLQRIGLSRNEAKAYTALLGCQPATAYEVSKKSAIPTSKIYETLNRLSIRGVVRPADNDDDGGKHYVALPPADFMERVRNTTDTQTRELEPLLDSMCGEAPTDYIWPLENQALIEAKAGDMISGASTSVLVSCWPEELDWLLPTLQMAESRNVKIALVHFGEPRDRVGATYHHPVEKTLYAEKDVRGLTLVVDGATVLIANFRADGNLDAAWSHNECFVTVAEDYIRHDVYITKVTRFLNDALTARFGEEYERLRDVYDPEASPGGR
jgi:sugar-specific transcriptional regulator TrmB